MPITGDLLVSEQGGDLAEGAGEVGIVAAFAAQGSLADTLYTPYSFEVEWRVYGETVLLGSASGVTNIEYVLSSLSADTNYEYRVRTVYQAPAEDPRHSEWSSWGSLYTGDITGAFAATEGTQDQVRYPLLGFLDVAVAPRVRHYWRFIDGYQDWHGNVVSTLFDENNPPVLEDRNSRREATFFHDSARIRLSEGKTYDGDWSVAGFLRIEHDHRTGTYTTLFDFSDSGWANGVFVYLATFSAGGGSFDSYFSLDLYANGDSVEGWYPDTVIESGKDYSFAISSIIVDGVSQVQCYLVADQTVLESAVVYPLALVSINVGDNSLYSTLGAADWGSPTAGGAMGELVVMEGVPAIHPYYPLALYNAGDGVASSEVFPTAVLNAVGEGAVLTIDGPYPRTGNSSEFAIPLGVQAAYIAVYGVSAKAAAAFLSANPSNVGVGGVQQHPLTNVLQDARNEYRAVVPSMHRVGAAFVNRLATSAPILQSISFLQTDNAMRRATHQFFFNALVEYSVGRRHLAPMPSQTPVSSAHVVGLEVPRVSVSGSSVFGYTSSEALGAAHTFPVAATSPVGAEYLGATEATDKDFVAARHRTVYSLENRLTVVEYLVSESPNE